MVIPHNIQPPRLPLNVQSLTLTPAKPAGTSPPGAGSEIDGAGYFSKPLPVPATDAAAMAELNAAKTAFASSPLPAAQKAQAVYNMLDAYHKQANTPLSKTLLASITREKGKHG